MLEATSLLLKKIREALSPRVLWHGSSPISGDISVVEADGQRRLIVNGFTQSRSLYPDRLTHGYWDGFIRHRRVEKVLLLGLGAGTAVKLLNYWDQPKDITAIELDPQIVEIAQEFFNLNDPNLKIILGDAKEEMSKLISKKKEKFDLIGVDVYLGGEGMEEEEEFYLSLKKLLKEKGEVVINKIFYGPGLEDYTLKLKKFFSSVEALKATNYYASNNTIVVLKDG